MTKAELRALSIEKRKNLTISEWQNLSEAVETQFKKLTGFNSAIKVGVFLPIEKNKEPRMTQIISYLWSKEIQTYAPKTGKAGSMEMLPYHSDTKLHHHKWGIPEPEGNLPISPKELDVVLVPLLWCNVYGHRIGYGKGFYDRYLPRCKDRVRTIGISLNEPSELIVADIEATDFPLQEILTPTQHLRLVP